MTTRRVPPVATVARGVRRRCGRCGGRRIFAGYFRLKRRCPTCGYRFQREEGFLVGAYFLNFSVTEGFMFVALMAYVLWRGVADSQAPLWPVMSACLAFAVLAPVAFYPVALSTWAALDLAMRPLEPDEEAEAATWLAAEHGEHLPE